MFFCLIIILLTLVSNSQLVLDGARYGLILWYHDVLPLLLPFMLISNIFILQVKKQTIAPKNAIAMLCLIGLLCGYPLGAKIASDFRKDNFINKQTASIFLPLCNNVSPMFLSGYIGKIILQNKYSFIFILFMLYTPYIVITALSLLLNHIHKTKHTYNVFTEPKEISSKESQLTSDNLLLQSIIQITYVGFYIMICSIIANLITIIPVLTNTQTTICCGILEITQGAKAISIAAFPDECKTALILACTSFGGISAILQTNQVLQKSGLSIFHYITIKIICACMTGLLTFVLLI